VLRDAARLLAEAGQAEHALTAVQAITAEGVKAGLLATVAQSLAQAAQTAQTKAAVAAAERALKAARIDGRPSFFSSAESPRLRPFYTNRVQDLGDLGRELVNIEKWWVDI
jgi:hypothetical protein